MRIQEKNINPKAIFFACLFFGMFGFVRISLADNYQPPIGIPAPSFGINDSHTQYSGKTYAAGNFAYDDAGYGPYSHYIDNSVTCSDTNNTFGTFTFPRCSIPTSIPAGSVVELHGGPYPYIRAANVVGTSNSPVFIRGYSENNKIVLNSADYAISRSTIRVTASSYVIVENITVDGSAIDGTFANRSSAAVVSEPSDHIAIRNVEVENYPIPDAGVDGKNVYDLSLCSAGSGALTSLVSNVVFYKMNIHDNYGDAWPFTYETGRHGFMATNGAEYIWFLDSEVSFSGDDGVQIYYTSEVTKPDAANHIYIGRNTIHDMGENAVDIKQSYDVIVSQNDFYNFVETNQAGAGSDGAAVVLNNDPPSDRHWVLYNKIHESNYGVRSQARGKNYVIGNIIYNIKRKEGNPVPTSSTGSYGGFAIKMTQDLGDTISNNTINDTDCGIAEVTSAPALTSITNNIISNLKEQTCFSIIQNQGTLQAYNNLLFNAGTLKKVINSSGQAGDPQYVGAAQSNFNISIASPAKDNGIVPVYVAEFQSLYGIDISKDFASLVRPQGSAWDIGAYEYDTGYVPPAATCSDHLQNQNETGVDCGGVCPACIVPTTYNLANFISVINHWLGAGTPDSNVDGNQIVNTKDLGIMMSGWSQ